MILSPALGFLPEDGYRFARGEAVSADNGMRVRLRRPLDFPMPSTYVCILPWKRSSPHWRNGARGSAGKNCFAPEYPGRLRAGQPVNEPDLLTASIASIASIAYEWTSMITGDNLHRMILHRNEANSTTIIPLL